MVKWQIMKKEINSAGSKIFEVVTSCDPLKQVSLTLGVIGWLRIKDKILNPSKSHNFEPEKPR